MSRPVSEQMTRDAVRRIVRENFGARLAGCDSMDQGLGGEIAQVLRRVRGAATRLAAYSDEFMRAVRGRKFRHPDTGNEVLFVSLPAGEQARVYQGWVVKNAPEGLTPDPDCPDCRGTGWYVGFRERRPCPTCVERQEERAEQARSREQGERRGPYGYAWDEAAKAYQKGDEAPNEILDVVADRFYDDPDWYGDPDDGWDRIYDEVLDEFMQNEQSPFHGGSPDPEMLEGDLGEAEKDEAEQKFLDAREWTRQLTDHLHQGILEHEEEMRREFGDDDDDDDKKASFTMNDISDWRTIEDQMGRTARYSQEFLDWARDRKFRNDQTGNRVRFDQLPPAERDRVHEVWDGAREDRMGRRMWVDAGPSDELVQVFRVRFDEGDLGDDVRMYGGERMFDEVLEELLYGEHSRFRGGSPDLDTEDDAEHERARQLYEDARRWAHLIVDRLEDERKGIAPRMASLATWRTVDEERVGSSRDEFDRQMQEGGRTFSNPQTGNRVKFKSLPHEVQDRIYKQWQATRPPEQGRGQRPQGEPSESEYERHLMERADESGMGHDDTRQMYADGIEGWSFLPVGDAAQGEREAFVVQQGPGMAAPPLREPGVPQVKTVHQPMLGPDGEPIEPPPPAQIRRQLSERMRDLGRSLMISGTRAPRQQMIEVGKALDALIDQLELLADQPGRQALKRRILLGLRNRVLSGR